MKDAAAILALATGSIAASYGEYYPRNGTVYETITTTAITTYCPYPTEIVHNSKTYTVTKATTLTITDCPCTVTKVSLLCPSLPPPTYSHYSRPSYIQQPRLSCTHLAHLELRLNHKLLTQSHSSQLHRPTATH